MQSKILDYIQEPHNKDWIVRLDYSPYTINQVKNIENNWINDEAISRKYVEWISIDWIESLDLDDAIWAERNNNWYTIWVHISDVTEAVKIYSPLDLEAIKRTTSIYRREKVINMFPEILSQNILSLNEDWEKLTLTAQIDLDNNWNIKNHSVFESKFKNRKRYDYENFIDDFINPESENHQQLQLMYEIARKRVNIRKIEWADMNFDESDRQAHIWNKLEKFHSWKKDIPSKIIQEFMILANIATSTICVNKKYNSIFRIHKSQSEKALYSNNVWLHTWLALINYTHFTSPIRRYADIIVHRILKIVHIRWEKQPYTKEEIYDIANHINVSRTVIDILWREYDNEIKWKNIVKKLKEQNWWGINISDLTANIRDTIWNWKKIPKAIVEEIINDLKNGEKWKWAWAIWVLLISWNDNIKNYLKKALLEEKKFSPKSVFNILNVTKILNTDDSYLFNINEKEVWNRYIITVNFRWKKILENSINYWKFDPETAISMLKKKVLKNIITHFCRK